MFDFSARLKQHFAALQSEAQFFSVRYVHRTGQRLCVRKNGRAAVAEQRRGRNADRAPERC